MECTVVERGVVSSEYSLLLGEQEATTPEHGVVRDMLDRGFSYHRYVAT